MVYSPTSLPLDILSTSVSQCNTVVSRFWTEKGLEMYRILCSHFSQLRVYLTLILCQHSDDTWQDLQLSRKGLKKKLLASIWPYHSVKEEKRKKNLFPFVSMPTLLSKESKHRKNNHIKFYEILSHMNCYRYHGRFQAHKHWAGYFSSGILLTRII